MPNEDTEKIKIYPADWGLMSHREDLRPEFRSAELDPLASNPDFDWPGLYEKLKEPDEQAHQQAVAEVVSVLSRRATVAAFKDIMRWLLEVNLQDHRARATIGVRAVAMAWVINPDQFQGASLAMIAKSMGFKGANSLSPAAADFSRRFGITNRFQKHDWRKE